MEIQELRQVRKWGNSGGIPVPKEWLGKQVRIELIDRSEDIRKETLEMLAPYFHDLIGIYLVGSYARGEESKTSDIDVLAISNSTKKSLSSGKYNIEIHTLEGIRNMLKYNPIVIIPRLKEAKVILNTLLLKELAGFPLPPNPWKVFLEECKRIINIDKKFMKLDKKEGQSLKSSSVAYSLILRLRGIFVIKCLISNLQYFNSSFKDWVLKESKISEKEYRKIYEVYTSVRENKKVRVRPEINKAEKLLFLLEKEVNSIAKKKKEAPERN